MFVATNRVTVHPDYVERLESEFQRNAPGMTDVPGLVSFYL